MIGFKLWSNFAAFRDPITITQNLSFPIPPKTTIGGMLAAIIGIDYNDYFNDPDFFNFGYSLVLAKPVRKKSFVQNYIVDYTKGSATKLNLINRDGLTVFNNKSFISPKPIFRELLIKPEYYVFIKDFKYETKAKEYLKKHFSEFSLYMGNSEFPGNYEYIECNYTKQQTVQLNSFTAKVDQVDFEPGKKYTSLFMATKTVNNREYRDYKNIIICDSTITLSTKDDVYLITTDKGSYYCEFI